MSSLEEFFSDDPDVPSHYICSLTETIFIEPALLNGRIYERSKILEWIKTNKTGELEIVIVRIGFCGDDHVLFLDSYLKIKRVYIQIIFKLYNHNTMMIKI